MTRAAATLLVMLAMAMAVRAQTPYAIYCDGNKTFYFTYRNEVLTENGNFTPEGATNALPITALWSGTAVTESGNKPGWNDNSTVKGGTKTVVFEPSFARVQPTNLANWFFDFSVLEEVQGTNYLDTSEATNMTCMFFWCRNLSTLDVSGFKTGKVTNMSFMFQQCENLKPLDVSGFDTKNVTNMKDMFRNCSRLTTLDVSGFDTGKVTSMADMFWNCSGLTALDLSGFDTGNVGSMEGMFNWCSSLTALDVSGFDTKNVENMGGMFYGCSGLTALDVSGFDTGNMKNMEGMFSWCPGLTTLDLSGFNTKNVENMGSMFEHCSGLTALDLSGFDTENVTNMWGMFQDCYSLSALDLTGFDTKNLTNMEHMFQDCENLVGIIIGDGWHTENVQESDWMFYGCESIVGEDGTTYDENYTDRTKAHAEEGGYMRKPFTLYDDEDNSETIAEATPDKQYFVTLKGRTIYTDGCWNTLCLPFNIDDFTGTPLEGFTVKELDTQPVNNGHATGFDSGTLYLNFKDATSIDAGKPYIVKKTLYNIKGIAAMPTYTATDGTGGSTPQQGYKNLLDGSTGGYMWRTSISEGDPAFCEFHADQPFNVTGYTLTTGNQNVIGDPTVWTLQAKLNEGDAWTVIDSRNVTTTPGDALPTGRGKGKNYTVQNPGIYQYFLFEVTQTSGNFMCLSELTLQGTTVEPVNVKNPMFALVTINDAAPTPVTSSDDVVSFIGNFDPVDLDKDDKTVLFMGGENTLYYPNAAMTIGSFRAYFQLNNGYTAGEPASNINSIVLNFGEETGLTPIPSPRGEGSDLWYAIDGRKLSGKPTQKGIYINNGKKVVIK